MQVEDRQLVEELLVRMRRIEGQARGVQRMLEENRDCEEIIMQLTAMRGALTKVAITLLAHNLERCLKPVAGGEPPADALERAKRVFMQFS